MANLTIAIDEELLHEARIKALHEHTSVNTYLRECLQRYVAQDSPGAKAVVGIRQLLQDEQVRLTWGGRTWTREELHDR